VPKLSKQHVKEEFISTAPIVETGVFTFLSGLSDVKGYSVLGLRNSTLESLVQAPFHHISKLAKWQM
jgi:hypothetical protein